MLAEQKTVQSLNDEDLCSFIIDIFARLVVHHGLWFAESIHQFGMEKALENLFAVHEKSLPIQIKRLAGVLGFEHREAIPSALARLDRQKKLDLAQAVAINWLANDGIWFQAAEFSQGMFDAKRANDTCWTRFSPMEAHSIRRLLNLGHNPGLEGLKKALNFRLYALINTQSIVDEGQNSFVFYMNECRVQAARKRKGLDDYPCKSGGMAEYPSFARAIDPRIETKCVGCPPDAHPQDWFCAWRFTIRETATP
jgi:hypothetical protein